MRGNVYKSLALTAYHVRVGMTLLLLVLSLRRIARDNFKVSPRRHTRARRAVILTRRTRHDRGGKEEKKRKRYDGNADDDVTS